VKILAIETATSVCAAAVVGEGRILSEVSLDEKYIHAEKLMTQVDTVLTQSGCTLSQLDAIAISIGPGSFTGLRIGLSVAKGLTFASGKPLTAVPTLLALAQRVVDERIASDSEHVLAALDARRDEVYCQWFGVTGEKARPLGTECDMSVARLIDEEREGRVFITGDAQAKLRQALQTSTKHHGLEWTFVPERVARCNAGTVGRIGEMLMMRGEVADVATLEPRYIKEFFFKQQS
jgi:tRNA threonylcarbamoyladenosine biosynthesis protein TsaB